MKTVIVGNSKYASLIYGYINEQNETDVVAFSVDEEYIESRELCGVPVIAYRDLENYYNSTEINLILAIGYTQNGRIRQQMFEKYTQKGYTFTNFIHRTAIIPNDLKIGTGNIILERAIICRQTNIGNGNLIWGGSNIGHDNNIGNFNTICAGTGMAGYVKIGNNCFIGTNAVVRNEKVVGSYSVVGAASYVNCDLPENSVVLPPRSTVLKGKGADLFGDAI